MDIRGILRARIGRRLTVMRAISLHQPFASAISLGLKSIETRSWPTSYRGPLWICAAARRMGNFERELILDWMYQGLIDRTQMDELSQAPLGVAVATCHLIGCKSVESVGRLQAQEPFGDFSPGRFVWLFDRVNPIKKPFPVRGRQGIFEVKVRQ